MLPVQQRHTLLQSIFYKKIKIYKVICKDILPILFVFDRITYILFE